MASEDDHRLDGQQVGEVTDENLDTGRVRPGEPPP